MRKRTILLLLLGALVLLLVGSLNIYGANWEHNGVSAYNHPEGGPNWQRVWLLPLDTGHREANELLTAELQRQLAGLGLQAEVAPAEYEMVDGAEQPVVLEYAVGDWSNRLAVLGRTAIARVAFRTGLYGELDTSNTLRLQGSFSGVGRYRGLVHSGRVNAEMATKVVSSFVEQVAKSMDRPGVARETPAGERNGFHWSFSLKWPDWWKRLGQQRSPVNHALVLSDVDYSWRFLNGEQEQQVYLYRTKQSGAELEAELLSRLPSDYAGEREFTDIDYNGQYRRTLPDGLVAHWHAESEALFGTSDPLSGGGLTDRRTPYVDLQDQVLERYVLVVDPPLHPELIGR